MKIILIILAAILIIGNNLLQQYRYHINFKGLAKKVEREGSIGIFAPSGYGKGVFGVAVVRYLHKIKSKKHRKQLRKESKLAGIVPNVMVHSNVGIDLSFKKGVKNMSNKFKLDSLAMQNKGSHWPFTEKDIIYLQETPLFLNGRDHQDLNKMLSAFTYFRGLIRHNFEGAMIYDAQHPNQVWVQLREQTGWFMQIKEEMKSGWFFNKMTIDVYQSLEDYNLDLGCSKKEQKENKMKTRGLAFRKKVAIPKWQSFKRYDSRAFKIVGDTKLQQWFEAVLNISKEQFIEMSYLEIEKLCADNIPKHEKFAIDMETMRYAGYKNISKFIEGAD